MQIEILDITTAIAIYGAILGTLSLGLSVVLGITELNRSKPRIKIKISTSFWFDEAGNASERLLCIEAINIGDIPTTISSLGWIISNKDQLVIMKPIRLQLPAELKERDVIKYYYPCRFFKIKKESQDIKKAFFKDKIGNTWTYKVKRKVLENWLSDKTDGWLIK